MKIEIEKVIENILEKKIDFDKLEKKLIEKAEKKLAETLEVASGICTKNNIKQYICEDFADFLCNNRAFREDMIVRISNVMADELRYKLDLKVK